jgi:hypothetical protein
MAELDRVFTHVDEHESNLHAKCKPSLITPNALRELLSMEAKNQASYLEDAYPHRTSDTCRA